MKSRLLRRREVESITGLSRSTIYSKISDGDFPQPVNIGSRAVAWIEREIDDWMQARIAERDAAA